MPTIDLNCDMGEGNRFDELIMPLISSCNIACGGHYGTVDTMNAALDLALENKVKIGAHPSYPDKKNFGRKPFPLALSALKKELQRQILALQRILEKKGGRLHHIKPHGALYNEIVHNAEKATCVIETVVEIDKVLILFVPPKSAVKKLAKGKLETWTEGFADRNYNPDLSLVSREKPKAVLTEKEQVFNRIISIVKEQKIRVENGGFLNVDFKTICMHSDTENAAEIVRYLSRKLPEENIEIS